MQSVLKQSIVYKKNIFEDLKDDLTKYYQFKNVLILTTKSNVNTGLTQILNAVSVASCSFKYFVAKRNFSFGEVNKLTNFVTENKFDLLIVYGAGKATNIARYFASNFCMPYFCVPTACSTMSYFSNLINHPFDASKNLTGDFAERVYISESIIKNTPNFLVRQGLYNLLALKEYVAVCTIENILLGENTDTSVLCEQLEKLERECANILCFDEESKLVLMDILIDVAEFFENVDLSRNSCYNLYGILKKIMTDNCLKIMDGELFFMSSTILLNCYKNMFSLKNIKLLQYPDFYKVASNIKKHNIFLNQCNNITHFKNILNKKHLMQRLNNLKEEFCFQVNKNIKSQKNIMKLLKEKDNVFTFSSPSFNDVFDAVNVLPFVRETNIVVSLIGGVGLANSF